MIRFSAVVAIAAAEVPAPTMQLIILAVTVRVVAVPEMRAAVQS